LKVSGKRVLLTGASGGIGGAIARELSARGAKLVLTGRNPDLLAKIGGEVGAETLAADLGDPASIADLLRRAGDVDILVANAGLPGTVHIRDWSSEEIARLLDVNLRAPILLARGLIDTMAHRGGGHMVFVSSLAGLMASPMSSIYSASKYGLRGFAQCLRLDVHDLGIGVSCVFPGIIRDAGMFVASGAKAPKGIGTNTTTDVARAVMRAIERNIPEIAVAPFGLRLVNLVAALVPGLFGSMQIRVGAHKVLSDAVGPGGIRK
jgi:short-subunit dehydrogenase